jgi:hypothetical protein
MFICTFIGLQESLAVFDAILASIEFPSQTTPEWIPGIDSRNELPESIPGVVWTARNRAGVAASACTREDPRTVPKEFELGAHRVQVTVPAAGKRSIRASRSAFRKGEFEIVLQNLGPATPPPRDPDALIDWGLAAVEAGVGHDQRREVRWRRKVTIDGREAVDIETWNRLDHTNPQRNLLCERGRRSAGATDGGDGFAGFAGRV